MIFLPDYVKFEGNESEKTILISLFLQQYELSFDTIEQYKQSIEQLKSLKKGLQKNIIDGTLISYLEENNITYKEDGQVTTMESGCSGSKFYNRLFNLVNNKWSIERGETELAKALLEPEKHKALLLGWSLEYFHVTRLAVSSLAGILADQLSQPLQRLAQQFVQEELFHERIMAKAFADTQWSDKQLYLSHPLPSTVAYMDYLKDVSLRRPHSYFASLFFYEGNEDDLFEFSENIPNTPDYHKIRDSHLKHANINIQGSHSDFSKNYFEKIHFLSSVQQQEIIEDLEYLNFLFYEMQDEVFSYYQVEEDLEKRLCVSQ